MNPVLIIDWKYLSAVDLYYVKYIIGSIESDEYYHRIDIADFADSRNLNQSNYPDTHGNYLKYNAEEWLEEDEDHVEIALQAYLNYYQK